MVGLVVAPDRLVHLLRSDDQFDLGRGGLPSAVKLEGISALALKAVDFVHHGAMSCRVATSTG